METTNAVVVDGRRLGKLPPKFDARTLAMATYVTPGAVLPTVPTTFAGTSKVATFPMYGNDHIGDCTCAALGHMTEVWSAWTSKPEIPKDQEVLALYEKVSGYDPQTGAKDNGAYLLDVLNEVQNHGYGDEKPIGPFVAIDPTNHDFLRLAMWVFGGAYAGFNLPVSAQTQGVWDVSSGNGSQPGSWGGHCVPLNDYDTNGVTCVTWGAKKGMTWAFIDRYCDEAFAIVDSDYFATSGKTPQGFDLKALQADLNAIHR